MIHKPTFKYMFMSHYATEVSKCPVKVASPDTASNDKVVSLSSSFASVEIRSQATATAAVMANIIRIRFIRNLF